MVEEAEFGPLPALEHGDRWKRRSQIVKRAETAREEVVEMKIFTRVTRITRAMRAVRVGLIVTSWAFVILGFMLMRNA